MFKYQVKIEKINIKTKESKGSASFFVDAWTKKGARKFARRFILEFRDFENFYEIKEIIKYEKKK